MGGSNAYSSSKFIHLYSFFERELALLVALQGESIWKGDKVEGTGRQVFIIDGRSRRKIQNYS